MTISTIAFAAGGAALVGGVVLFLTAPSKDTAKATETAHIEVSLVMVGSGGGVVLQGSW